jgi:hypothetical protein
MKRALLVATALALLFHYGYSRVSAQAAEPLSYFKSFFVTGDYVIAGVGLHATGAGNLVVSGVPEGEDVVAAFLYWQVLTREETLDAGGVGARFRGNPLSSPQGLASKRLGPGAPACAIDALKGPRRAVTYRMDVLRYFAVDEAPGPNFGKLAINGTHTVQLPISNHVEPLGASLVVIYRRTGDPLRVVSVYDGAFAMDQSEAGLQLAIQGLYDARPGPARFSLVGGSGRADREEVLRFNEPPFADATPLATNAFSSSLGDRWDNPTFGADDGVFTPAPPAGGVTSQVTTSVSKEHLAAADCVTFAAAIYSTEVEDRDGDGLLDAWEESTTPILDPNGQPLPNLGAMGADPDVPDVFVEIAHLQTGPEGGPLADYSYGGVVKPAHSHQPSHEALKLVGDAFKGSGTTDRVRMHFDMGPNYPPGDPNDPKRNAEEYLVPRSLARGGEAIDEAVTVCARQATDPEYVCQFGDFPGTVGWKTGYRFLRDEVFSITPALPALPPGETADDYCGTLVPNPTVPGQRYVCERRFDENRLNIFRFSLFAHALGLPKSEVPCLKGTQEIPADHNDRCVAPALPNPAFHTPVTSSGVGDFPGADSQITLGGFPDASGLPIGSPMVQAGTLMHEFGHNFLRRHGGEAFEPNCKPTYLSVMNYMYQLRGLVDDNGVPLIDFSNGVGPTVAEGALSANVGSPTYRIGWYAPLDTSYLAGRAIGVRKHCNGSERLAGEPEMVRIDAPRPGVDIDWDADGNPATVVTTQDVNYSGGPFDDVLAGSDDWSNLFLNQTGIRRNVGALYVDAATSLLTVGPTSINTGKGDLGKGDLGKGDLGKGDLGKGDLGKGDLGKGDLGKGDLGKGDLGKGDLGGGDLFLNDPNNPPGEIDAEIAADLNRTPPNVFQACVSGVDCETSTAPRHDIQISFESPNVAGVASYSVYRVDGTDLAPGQTWVPVATIDHQLGVTAYSATESKDNLVAGQQYTYFAVATYLDGGRSDVSRRDTITAFRDPAAFVVVAGLPPAKTKFGTSASMVWQYRDGATVVDSSSLTHTVTVCRVRATGCTFVDQFTSTAAGPNTFAYAAGNWTLTMAMRDGAGTPYPVAPYQLTITPNDTGYQAGGPFQFVITR